MWVARVETAWDVFSLATGAKSFVDNVRQGNVGAAILDGVGVVADAAAVIVPFVPGGVGAGIKAVRVGDKVLDAVQTGKTTEKVVEGAKTLNKNANNAEGHFMLYEIKSVDGEALKVGKADASRINSKGEPVRMKASERAAQKTHPGAIAYPKKDLGKTTTGKAKEAEAADVRNQRASGSELPLNKERDKRYRN